MKTDYKFKPGDHIIEASSTKVRYAFLTGTIISIDTDESTYRVVWNHRINREPPVRQSKYFLEKYYILDPVLMDFKDTLSDLLEEE